MAALRRMGQSASPTGWRGSELVRSNQPPWPGGRANSGARCGVCSARRETKRDEALLSASRGAVPQAPAKLPGHGVRERSYARRLPRTPERSASAAAATVRTTIPEKLAVLSLLMQAAIPTHGEMRLQAVKSLSTQIVGNTQAKESSPTVAPKRWQSSRQRLLRLRTGTELGNGEARAKIRNFRACASTVRCKPTVNVEDCGGMPVDIACITAGKSVPLQQEWCVHRRTHWSRQRHQRRS